MLARLPEISLEDGQIWIVNSFYIYEFGINIVYIITFFPLFNAFSDLMANDMYIHTLIEL